MSMEALRTFSNPHNPFTRVGVRISPSASTMENYCYGIVNTISFLQVWQDPFACKLTSSCEGQQERSSSQGGYSGYYS